MGMFMSREKLLFTHKPLAMQNNCAPAESYQKGRVKPKNHWHSCTFRLFWFIPTRQNKSQSKQFCIGDLTLFGLIWSQLSISHRVSDFLLSKFYQGVIANGLENRVQASCHQSSLQFYHKVEQDASCKAKRYVSRVILRAVVQDSYCGHSRFQLRHSDHAM